MISAELRAEFCLKVRLLLCGGKYFLETLKVDAVLRTSRGDGLGCCDNAAGDCINRKEEIGQDVKTIHRSPLRPT